MPTGIFKRTKEMYDTRKGKVPWNKGIQPSDATKLKLRLSHLGKKLSEETKKKMSLSAKGKIKTKEHLKNISIAKMGTKLSLEHKQKFLNGSVLFHTGRKQSPEHIEKRTAKLRGVPHPDMLGELNPAWKGGVTPETNKIRGSIESTIWSHGVMCRDNFTDAKTGIRGGNLVAHHIENFSSHPELRFAIDNGITLSVKSHHLFHHIYGIKNNSREQLIEFLNNKTI